MSNLSEAVKSFKDKRVLVVGDLMLDQYTHGEVKRISPEAPVPVLTKTEDKFIPGGAANVANNLASLGAKVSLSGVVGEDVTRDKLLALLENSGVNTDLVITVPDRPTTLKRRFVTGGTQQLLRVDEEVSINLSADEEKHLLSLIEDKIAEFDAVIMSDYIKGVFSENVAKKLIEWAKRHGEVVVGDLKPPSKVGFKGADVLTPNTKEAFEMSGETNVDKAGRALVEYFGSDILMTKGAEGMSIFLKNGERQDITTKKIKVYDVSGAGDTAVAALTLGLISGLNLKDSALIANCAAGVVVQKPGTATLSAEELLASLDEEHHIEDIAKVPKLWGYEKWLENNEKYCSKILVLNKGFQCSLHYHKIKDEMFIVLRGHVRLEIGDKVLHMKEGHYVRLEPGTVHRFRGIEDSEILEVSTHHMEDDSYRLEESRVVEETTS